MNTNTILKYGHETVLAAVDGLPEAEWYTPGVCGEWSVKDIIAHLASFEHMLVDVLHSLLGDGPTPNLDKFGQDYEQFNETEVEVRRSKSVAEVLAEYTDTHTQAARLLTQIPYEGRRLNGTLPWYGEEYDLEDFIVFTFYGHKQEHCAQIGVFRDQLVRELA
jgi:hypothetical protein